jgi:hypothetical protein
MRQAGWHDLYPAWQGYADECEALLEFIADKKQFDRFVPRLCSRVQQRDEALNEIRVAYLLDSMGYTVLAWEPVDAPTRNVEFSVDLGPGVGSGFVEVKSPGWEAELSIHERQAGRKNREKNIHLEARAAAPVEVIRRTVEKAAPKFSGNFPSLIVISDDCFVNLGNWGWGPLRVALTGSTLGYGDGLFKIPGYSAIGGVALLWVKSVSPKGVEYAALCMENPNATSSAKLPVELIKRLCTKSAEPLRDIPEPGGASSSYAGFR